MNQELYVGLMSGTSLDGVDAVLVDFSGASMSVLAHVAQPFPAALRAELLALNQPGPNEIHRGELAGNALARVYAAATLQLLNMAKLPPSAVLAIGAHGQTVRHRPGEFDGDPAQSIAAMGYTVQLNNPSLLAELTGIDVVADFRRRDLAAGGQGAPLVPAFHRAVFGREGEHVLVLNLGGIANLTVLAGEDSVIGFDCGPGNVLMDGWCEQHTGQPFDTSGKWAAQGEVHPELLASLLTEPFLAKAPPKSTGRDLFHTVWLSAHLTRFAHLGAVDVQATLTEFTALASAASVNRFAPPAQGCPLIVCGGGALNGHLMNRLQKHLPNVKVESSAEWGLPPLQVEGAAFAWLARKMIRREPGSLPAVTGAQGGRVLGALYPK